MGLPFNKQGWMGLPFNIIYAPLSHPTLELQQIPRSF